MITQTEQAVSIHVRAGDLAEELRFVAPAAERRSTIPILGDVLLRAETGALVLVATDLDTSNRSSCPAKCEGLGAVAVPAELLSLIARDLVTAYGAEAEVRIEINDSPGIAITSGSTTVTLGGRPAEDWPTMPVVAEPKKPSSIDSAVLAALARQVQIAITQEETRFQLNGALLEAKPGIFTLVATDGHRLLIRTASAGIGKSFTVMLSRGTLQQIQFIAPNGGEVTFWNDAKSKHHAFRCGERMITGRSLDVNFPKYREVIATDNDKRFKVDVAALQGALRRVYRAVNHRAPAVRLTVSLNNLGLRSSNPGQEIDVAEFVAIDYPTGAEFFFGINPGHLLQWLEVCGADRVVVSAKDAEGQIIFRPEHASGEHTYVVMPMRLAE